MNANTAAIQQPDKREVQQYLAQLFLQAHFALGEGDDAGGRDSLRQALGLAKVHTVEFINWLHPALLGELLHYALDAGIETGFVRYLLDRYVQRKDGVLVQESEPAQWPVQIYTLGRFALRREERTIRFSRKSQQKPLDMLKALVTFGGRGVKKDRVAEVLWPEAEGDLAQQAFATTLHRLRKLVGKDAITLCDGKLTLDPKHFWVDLWEFERAMNQAEAERDPKAACAAMKRVFELYKGPFLQNEDHYWLLTRREQLRTKLLGLCQRWGAALQDASRFEQAVWLYRKALEVNDLSEELYQGLIRSYGALGKKAEAISTYLQCRKLIRGVLHMEPSPETEAIYRSLRVAWRN